ncbi:MAG: thiol:disulfide interchange protein DsbG [Steroidobacteraceae bacterium]
MPSSLTCAPRTARLAILALALALIGPLPVSRAAGRASTLPPPPPALAALIRTGKVKLLTRFSSDVPGLTGYVVRFRGATEVVYGSHGYLFSGELISPQSVDMNGLYRQRYAPVDDAAVIGRLERSGHLIAQGPARAPLLYAIIDPNCSFCYRFYHMAEPLIGAGRLQVRWVLVGFLERTSQARAAAILSAANPAQALRLDEDRFDVAREHGGIAPARRIAPQILMALKTHLNAMSDIGGDGTPTLLYRARNGVWKTQVGLPSQAWLDAYARPGARR